MIIYFVLGAVAIVLLSWSAVSQKSNQIAPREGSVCAGWEMWFTSLGSLAMSVACVVVFAATDQTPALFLSAFFALGGVFVGYISLPVFTVSWDDNGICGASLMWPTRRILIAWDDVEQSTSTLASTIRIRGRDGRSIEWSTAFPGHMIPLIALGNRRPDLGILSPPT